MNDKFLTVFGALAVLATGLFPKEGNEILAIIPALIGAAAGIGGALIGAGKAGSDRDQAMALIEQSVKELEAMGIPSVEAQQIALEEYRSQGILTPEMEQSINLGDSAMGSISLDPRYKQSQLDALSELQNIGRSDGMTLSDRASLAGTMADINADERGKRQAILQSVRERGQLGSGLELSAQLQNQQDAATRAHLAGLNQAGMAQQRKMDAIMQAGQLGGNIRGQEFGEQADIAKAKDVIAQWNAANRQDVAMRNVNRGNDAQAANLANAQSLANANVDQRNKTQTYNKGLLQQDFQNRLNVNNAKANARGGQANQLNQNANRTENLWGNIGQAAGQAGFALYNDQQRSKDRDASSSLFKKQDEDDAMAKWYRS